LDSGTGDIACCAMVINFTIQYWQLALAFPFLFFFGYVFYAGCLNAWKPSLSLWIKIPLGIAILIFGAGDVAWRYSGGMILMLDISHGWTFSQTLCYYYHQTGYRKGIANFFAWLLNPFNEGHIS
jgi:hypothetical protein